MNNIFDPTVEYISHVARIYGNFVFCLRTNATNEITHFVVFDGYVFNEVAVYNNDDYFAKYEFVKYPF